MLGRDHMIAPSLIPCTLTTAAVGGPGPLLLRRPHLWANTFRSTPIMLDWNIGADHDSDEVVALKQQLASKGHSPLSIYD